MPPQKHVVITGTGRAGTTFLVQLLTHLGLDTGFSVDELQSSRRYNQKARAGLEHDLRNDNCPYIVKHPKFCDYADEILQRDDRVIEHVFIPIRDLQGAAESRRYVTRTTLEQLPLTKRLRHAIKKRKIPGGLSTTQSSEPGAQEAALQARLYRLLLALSDASIPVTFLRYPRIVQDPAYLFDKLGPVLGGIARESFREAFDRTARPELVHSFNSRDR